MQVTYDTSRVKLGLFIGGIRTFLVGHPQVDGRNIQVRLNNLADSSLDILVLFNLSAETYTAGLESREEILLHIMEIAEAMGIEFAFPTRTIHVAGHGATGATLR